MNRELRGRAARLLVRRRSLALAAIISALVLAPGLRTRLCRVRGETDVSSAYPVAGKGAPLPPPELVQLKPGMRLIAGGAPPGWTHLILETVPRLAAGDLDTVSPQAFEVARRIRPLIVADVQPSPSGPDGRPRFRLARVGVGLCAPGQEPDSRVVVAMSSVEGTAGPWTTKQRLILTAMSIETSRARLDIGTSTFALLRTPVTFLVEGTHQKLDVSYALMVDPDSGSLRTLIWAEVPPPSVPIPARLLAARVFDSPMHIKASKVLGSIPVAWSFAVTQLPPGADVAVPAALRQRLEQAVQDAAEIASVEREFSRLVPEGGQAR